MQKLDLKRDMKQLYNPSPKTISVVQVPAMNFLMIDGKGDPNVAKEYVDALQALYAVAYTLKFNVKKEKAIDFPVMPLEGLWWVDDIKSFSSTPKSEWLWTMMIMQPAPVTAAMVRQVAKEVVKKKELAALDKIRFEKFNEGLAAQILYFGPYSDEGPTITSLHAFIRDSGHSLSGKHHEIYLGDPRKSAPSKLRTVIRQPMRKIK